MVENRSEDGAPAASWTFLSNHAHVMLCIAREPSILLREVARQVGITERAVQRIVADLEAGGYLRRIREGRRNHYEVRSDLPLRHPIEAHRDVSALLALILPDAERGQEPETKDRVTASEGDRKAGLRSRGTA